MKVITIDEDSERKRWHVPDEQYNNLHKVNQIYDILMYNYVVESIASRYLRGKLVIESFGGIGMSSLRYLKFVDYLTINDIDEATIEAAKFNLKNYSNIEYIVGDYLDIFPTQPASYDFVDFDNFTHLDIITYENLPSLLKVLNDHAVGFLFTTSYQFIVSRNFQHNYQMLEDKFNIKFKKQAIKKPTDRCLIFAKALGKGLEKQSGGRFVLSEIWFRNNVAKLLFLNKDLHDGLTVHECYKQSDIAGLLKKMRHKPLVGGD